MDGEKKRLLLDGEIAEANLMRFGWIDTEARPYEKELESAREEICHVEEMEIAFESRRQVQISRILD